MANDSPKTEHLTSTQFQPVGEVSMGKVIGTRYPVDVDSALNQMDSKKKQDYIREAVELRLRQDGRL